MSNDQGNKPLSLGGRGKLELKKTVEAGSVRQSFPHGRSKVVTVEVKKKRSFAQGADGQVREVKNQIALLDDPKLADPAVALSRLTQAEVAQRLQVLQEARRHDEEQRRHEEQEAAAALLRKQQEPEPEVVPEPAPEAEAEAPAETDEQPEAETAADAVAEPAAEATAEAAARAATPAARTDAAAAPRPVATPEEEDEEAARKKRLGAGPAKAAPAKVPGARRDEPRRRAGKLTISAVLSDDDRDQRGRSVAAMRRAIQKEKRKHGGGRDDTPEKVIREVIIPETVTAQELANRMAVRSAEVIKALMRMGVMATINQVLDADTAELVVAEFGHNVKRVSEADVEEGLRRGTDEDSLRVPRPPVVTIMGHVDHGKTSLLDALRETDVVSGEAGGITQHIGAYQVQMASGDRISFIDTPGHEAFTAMRARGAKVTDIVVLVVAADDGIMPQTVEAIRHAKAANVPLIVAVNKIDKPDANPERVRTELLNHEVVVESMGGEVQCIEVSAKEKLNLDKLEEAILLQAEILDLRANPEGPAEGAVIEAKVEKGRGPVATVLVQKGTLKVGDVFVCGREWGRVRALLNDRGERLEQAGPATPVEVLGLDGPPAAGDDVIVVEDESRAREVSAYRQRKEREAQLVASTRGTLDQMFAQIKAGEAKELGVVIKGDVQGSVEALQGTLKKLETDEVKVRVLHSAVGGINESDVTLAKASGAVIIAFNVRANPQAREMARRDNVEIRYYSIIYDVADDVKKLVAGLTAPTLREKFIGYAEIRQVFTIDKIGKVAGCRVTEGIIKRGCKVRLLRDNVVIHEGDLAQLKRFKDDVREVKEGFECGIMLARYDNIQVGDLIECFEIEEVAAAV